MPDHLFDLYLFARSIEWTMIWPGLAVAFLIAGAVSAWCIAKLKKKPGGIFLKSLLVALTCLASMFAAAFLRLVAMIILSWRISGAFGDGYIYGALAAPVIAFIASLVIFSKRMNRKA